jgi:acetyl coenzyme A synthetase (ADP forming)-like protein
VTSSGSARGRRESLRQKASARPEVSAEDAADSLGTLLHPRSVAVVGASEKPNSVGRAVFSNLLGGHHDLPVYPVNPKRRSVLRQRAYPELGALPESVDLVVVATPAATVPGIVRQCVESGARGAVVLSAGFREMGEAGAELEREMQDAARSGPLRIIGPNCLGIMNPITGLNATFAPALAEKGRVGFISQSGAIGTAILDWSAGGKAGFSAFVSLGSMLDVGWGDLIRYLGNDPQTRSIVIYMESIGDARSFLTAAREVALSKPIIVLKAGATEAAARASAAHTGCLSGNDEVLSAAFRRCGVLRVQNIASLFYMADVLSKQPPARGPRLSILTNAGGPGVLATDALCGNGGVLATPSDQTLDGLDELLPAHWSHANPIDVLSDADPDRYARAIEIVGEDRDCDGLLVILTPQAMTDPKRTAEALATAVKQRSKPVIASWMGGERVAEGVLSLARSGIPCFPYPDTAARVFTDMWRYGENLRALYETPFPDPASEQSEAARAEVERRIQGARRMGEGALCREATGEVLRLYGIRLAERDRSDAPGGPPLRIASSVDPQFGPVLSFGIGGELAEFEGDRALGLPPLNSTLARRVMEQTRVYRALRDRPDGEPVDLEGLELLLVRVSRLVAEQRWIREIGIDPLCIGPEGWTAREARIALHDPDLQEEQLPKLAIRPYPSEYASCWTTRKGQSVVIRPIRPEDEPLMVEFHRTLSDETVRSRYLGAMGLHRRIEHERLTRLCFIDYEREIALVVDWHDPESGERQIWGVGRLVRLHRSGNAEYAIVISDQMQGEGLGGELLRRLIEVARAERIGRIVGNVLPDNRRMLKACRRLGFRLHSRGAETTLVELPLS